MRNHRGEAVKVLEDVARVEQINGSLFLLLMERIEKAVKESYEAGRRDALREIAMGESEGRER